nr:ALPV-311 [Albatrosspox virus]
MMCYISIKIVLYTFSIMYYYSMLLDLYYLASPI